MQTTTNYGFKKPEASNTVNIDDLNYNADEMDEALTPTADPLTAPTGNGPSKLVDWVGYLANRIKAISGKTNWYDAPDTTLAAAKAHADSTSPHSATAAATANRLMLRDSNGRAKVAVPSASDDIARKDTVDTVQSNLNNHAADYTLQVPYAGITTNSGNDYAISTPVITSLGTGMAVAVKINVDSTGATTLNWNGKGAKSIKKANGNSVSNLKAGGIYTLRYDGTNFILQGEGASGNATASDLLSGKTATVDAGEITGAMTNVGQQAITPGTTQQAITQGYHNGSGYVEGDSDLVSANIKSGATIFGVAGDSNVVDTSAGDASAANILSGKKAYVDGELVTGTMVNRGAVAITPGTTNQTIQTGYHNGSGYVQGDADLVAANIKNGVSIFGVTGNIRASTAKGEVLYLNGYHVPMEEGAQYGTSHTIEYDHVDDVDNVYFDAVLRLYTRDSSVSNYNTVVTSNPFDLTGVSAIMFFGYGSDTTSDTSYLIASTSKMGDHNVYNARVMLPKCTEPGNYYTQILDVSGLTGHHYIRLHAVTGHEVCIVICGALALIL